MKKLKRFTVGQLPLIYKIAERMHLKEILYEFLPPQPNEEIPTVEILMLLICNLTIGKSPLYELEEWLKGINLDAVCLGRYKNAGRFTDDRFGNALDKLFEIDRASLMTRIVIEAIKTFNICLEQIHNDSTSVKAFGEYPGKSKTGLEFKKGRSKDHRPDLKQLVFTLSIAEDGAVPIHHKVYSGNRNDDTTHIETWTMLCQICQRSDFLYVADCKLCTDKQLGYIVGMQGRAVTTIPESWGEVSEFKNSLRNEKKKKTEIWRKQNEDGGIVYYYAFDEECYTKQGYKIHWILSTDHREEDQEKREFLLIKAEKDLSALLLQINKRNLKTEEAIRKKCDDILKKRQVSRFLNLDICKTSIEYSKTKKRKDKFIEVKEKKSVFMVSWNRNNTALKAEENVDGVFPILATDENLTAKEALVAFKYQPRLEKRFSQFKSVHNAAPILFKKIERVEANMLLFFLSLMIQALLEREIRNKMTEGKLDYLNIYPENRESVHPTTCKIFDRFSHVSTYEIIAENSDIKESYRDDLSETQLKILEMLGMEEEKYWQGTEKKVI